MELDERSSSGSCAGTAWQDFRRTRTFSEYRVRGTASGCQVSRTQMILLLALPQHEQPPADRLLARQTAPADPTRGGCSHTRRPTAPAAAPRSSTAPAARAPRRSTMPMPSPSNSSAGSSVDGTSSNTASTSSTRQRRDVLAEQQARRVLGARHLLGAVHERGHLAREHPLRLALLRRARRRRRRARRSPRARET